ncbi:hypothetical protein FRB99_008207, partial [Tulasnella sp. 403]
MVHVPQTAPVRVPGRRGRPPKNRDPLAPTAGADGSASDAPKPTFVSSLSFKVKGSVPISKSSPSPPPSPQKIPENTVPTPSQPSPATTSANPNPPPLYEVMRGRAPRKSKIDAMAAINARSVSPSDLVKQSNSAAAALAHSQPQSSGNTSGTPAPRSIVNGTSSTKPPKPSLPESPPVDFSYIKLPKRQIDPPRAVPRPFELEDCPVFYPTADEWKDPMQYVKSISPVAKPYGICKIVPPAGWKMPFVIDTKTFRFKTRLQRLNSIEASSRAKLNFLEQLYRFHQQQDQAGPVIPTINHKPLDLWLLRKEVHGKGGFEIVSRTKQWGEVARIMGYDGLVGVSSQLKNAYTRIILPFEQFSDHIRNSPSMSLLSPASFRFYPPSAPSRMRMGAKTVTPTPTRMSRARAASKANTNSVSAPKSATPTRTSTPMSISSSSLSEPPEDVDIKPPVQTDIQVEVSVPPEDDARNRTTTPKSPPRLSTTPLSQSGPLRPIDRTALYVQGDTCEVCHSGDNGTKMLLCDGCDRGYHTFCLDPPLVNIPKGQWYCHICLFDTGGDYGFDEGEEHSLHSFQERDFAFRKAWFESHPPKAPEWEDPHRHQIGNVMVSEDDVEREFWRLVESPLETVEIEYGADVHSTTHGRDGWNVNNMPIVSDSLLRYVKSDISGMTVPWIYVGMVFSTFCWHNEDHYTYSVNYMHWGETKTWYGVPGDDAEKFEAAIRSEAPDLFDAQPDLLFQLVTLMSPKRLREADVRVYGCNQRPGEYVITFPRAYHAGFNHGLNLNEAVNFAIPDWLTDGRDCVRRYQEHQKLPVFSHEELLITITQHSSTIKTAVWLLDSLREMVDKQLELRNALRQTIPRLTESLEEHDWPEEQYQCVVCKGFTYLAQVICDCTKQVACLEHWDSLCSCASSARVLRKRFDDDQLLKILAKVEERSKAPLTWRDRLRTVLMESPIPNLADLRVLVAEAEEMAVPLEEYPNLKQFVERAEVPAGDAARILAKRVPPPFKKNIPRRPPTDIASLSGSVLGGEFGVEDIRDVLWSADQLSIRCEEIDKLQGVLTWIEKWEIKAEAMLRTMKNGGPNIQVDCNAWDDLFMEAFTHNVRLRHLPEVEKVIKRIRLIDELKDVEDTALTLEDVQELLAQARICDLPSEQEQAKKLEQKVERGKAWYARAVQVLEHPLRSIEDLNKLVSPAPSVPVMPALLERIDATRARARELEKQAKGILQPPSGRKTTISDALRLVNNAQKEFIIPAIQHLHDCATLATRYEQACAEILLKRYSPSKPLFEELRDMRTKVQTQLWMFSIPSWEVIDQQLVWHDVWLEKLPWYRIPQPAMQGKLIVDDVIENTRPEDNKPPADPDCTCICPTPVRVTSDRQNDAVQCDHCGAKFHAKCIEGSCPFCDHHHWNGAITKPRNFQYTDLLPIAIEAPELTKNYSLAWKHLDIIITFVEKLNRAIDNFLSVVSEPSGPMPLPDAIAQIRHFLRKLYKIQFVVKPRADLPAYGLTLCHLHRTLATSRSAQNGNGQQNGGPKKYKSNRRPKFIFTAENLLPAAD